MRISGIAGLVTIILIAGLATAAPASATSLDIDRFAVSPSKLDAPGGTVTLTAKTRHAQSCTISSSIPINGLPTPVGCADGSVRRHFTVPANRSKQQRKIVFVFAANNSGLHARAHVTVTQDPPKPKINSVRVSAHTVSADHSTKVHFRARFHHAATCRLSSKPALDGLPVIRSCGDGSFRRTVTFPANHQNHPRTWKLRFAARNAFGAKAIRRVTIDQNSAPTAPPIADALTLTPSSVTPAGGTHTISTTIVDGDTCTLSSTPSLGISGTPVNCFNGSFSRSFSIPANNTARTKSYKFTFTAMNSVGSTQQTLTATQPPKPPALTNLKATPDSVPATGGSLTISATLARAATCTFTSNPDVGSTNATDCSGGSFSKNVNVPLNPTHSPRTYAFTLKATGPGGTTTGKLTLTQPANPSDPPAITELGSTPASLTWHGGHVTVNATVEHASTCTFTSSPNLGGSTTPEDCSDGSFTRAVDIPQNDTTTAKPYTLTLKVAGPGGTTTGTLTLTTPPRPPAITNLASDPATVTSARTPITISADIARANTCTLTSSPSLGISSDPVDCSGGSFSRTATIPVNNTTSNKTYVFTLKARGNGGTVTGTLTVIQPAATPSITDVSVTPDQIFYVGADVTITATVHHATTCTFVSTPALTGTAPGSFTCSGTNYSFSRTVHVPQNNTGTQKTYSLKLTANGGAGTPATALVTLHVPPRPPTMSNFQADPPTFPAAGTSVTFSATVTRAATCTFTTNPDNLGNSNAPVDCTGGSFARTLTIPANHSGSIRQYSFTLLVSNTGGTESQTITINQPST